MRTLKAGSTIIIGFITEAPSVSRSTSNIPVTNQIKHRENFNKVRICKHLKVYQRFPSQMIIFGGCNRPPDTSRRFYIFVDAVKTASFMSSHV